MGAYSYNIHAVVAPMSISYQGCHYCELKGAHLSKYWWLISSSSKQSIFQYYKGYSGGQYEFYIFMFNDYSMFDLHQ